jgi:hypothetical protein
MRLDMVGVSTALLASACAKERLASHTIFIASRAHAINGPNEGFHCAGTKRRGYEHCLRRATVYGTMAVLSGDWKRGLRSNRGHPVDESRIPSGGYLT